MRRLFLPVLLVTIASSGAAQQPSLEIRAVPPSGNDRYIVEFRATPAALAAPGVSARTHDRLFTQFEHDVRGGVAAHARSEERHVLREFRSAILAAVVELHPAAAERVRRLPYVRSVRRDSTARALGGGRQIGATAVLDPRSRVNAAALGEGEGIVVAVIDSGVDYSHPALGGGFGPGFKVSGGYDFVDDDDDPMDENGHGTHVAGIVAAASSELTGVAPGATLLAYRVLDAQGNGPLSGVIAAIERSLDPDADGDFSDRADVINLSLGAPGDADDPVSRAVDNAVAAGVVVVVAAGNTGGVSTVASPGVARDAITVAAIDDEDHVTSFSSRGPSPGSLAFKPDVAAGGDSVLSTLPNGIYGPLSGTSMAAPHVAGVAALLLERHPDWKPSRVKGAMAGTAAAIAASPFARGAGKVDSRAADLASFTADVSGLSFGIRPSRTATSRATQTFRLTNHSTAPQTLTLRSEGAPEGAVVTLQAATLTIPAGGSSDVTVELTTANDRLEFPDDWLLGGDVEVVRTTSIRIPWGILRASRATVTYDGIVSAVVATDSAGGRSPNIITENGSEIFLPSGFRFDFMLTGWDPAPEGQRIDTQRTIVRAGVYIDGDHHIDLRSSEASLELRARGRDENGIPLRDRPTHGAANHTLRTQVMRIEGDLSFSLGLLERVGEVAASWYSPLPENYAIRAVEYYIDTSDRSIYTIEHPVLESLHESVELQGGGTELLKAQLAPLLPTRGNPSPLSICVLEAITASFSISSESCIEEIPARGEPLRVFITPEAFRWSHSGIVARQRGVATQALRGRDDRIVMSSEETPPPVARSLDPDETFAVATGLVYPFALPGSRRGIWFRFPFGGYYGSGGELLGDTEGIEWIAFDSSGAQRGIGSFRDTDGVLPPLPAPASRLVAIRHDLPLGGRRSRGTLDIRFAPTESDLDAPTLTSLRLVDGTGRAIVGISPGQQTALRFSIADIDFAAAATSRASRPELTRAFWRRSGIAADWTPVPVRVTGEDHGSQRSLKRYPAGEIYEATLPIFSAGDAGWYDVRIEFEDAAGNRVEWTQELAITIGTPSVDAPRRGVRR